MYEKKPYKVIALNMFFTSRFTFKYKRFYYINKKYATFFIRYIAHKGWFGWKKDRKVEVKMFFF